MERRTKVSARKKTFGERERELFERAVGARRGLEAGFERFLITKERGKIRRKPEKWLRIADVDNKGASLKKLMEFLK